MKIKNLLLIAGIMMISAIYVKPAAAVGVDFYGPYANMSPDPLTIGQTGTITGASIVGDTVLNVISGTLPTGGMITFSYDFDGLLGFGPSLLSATADYSYNNGGQLFEGYAAGVAGTSSGFSVAEGTVDGSASTALAFASAELKTFGFNSGTTVIRNLSAGTLDFASTFLGVVTGAKSFTITYEVSAVPVPAALPMFGLSLMALAGYRRRKSKKNDEIALAA